LFESDSSSCNRKPAQNNYFCEAHKFKNNIQIVIENGKLKNENNILLGVGNTFKIFLR